MVQHILEIILILYSLHIILDYNLFGLFIGSVSGLEFRIRDDEFDIDFMREHGYTRRKCRVCGAFFWTPDPDQDVCGESPCVDYTFLRNPPTRRRYSLGEMREEFLKFFERNGHTIIDPYPVVARWRDDLLVTIASIADFQPYVTAGISNPPANPLVVSQPCLRFEDINNVGLTAGRHLTIFEMGGAHAFNRKGGEYYYWKDGTIAYHHEFATEVLGVPEEYITYKEHFWVGGGNAGPDVEGIINGLEVSTLVFMMYEIVDDKLVETPVFTVDTGYGIERWTWLSQGSPSAFHAIYGDVLDKVMSDVGLDIPEEILYMNSMYSPRYEFEKMDFVRDIRGKIAEKLGLDRDEVIDKLAFYDDVMRILDHSKAAILLIRDGAVPSNVKEGYLTRMLLRRIFKIMMMRGLIDYVHRLFGLQIDYWSRHFANVKDVEDVVFEVVELELNRYKGVMDRLPRIVERYRKKYGSIGLDQLVEIYDSYGISPDVVSEYMKESLGISIEVPANFYDIVAERHGAPEREAEVYVEVAVSRTEPLYYRNSYWKSMTARVTGVGDNYIVLDKTVFYPEGGGQVGDTGILLIDGVEYRVVDTKNVAGEIRHYVDRKPDEKIVGAVARGLIDWDRRYSLMRHHTATHILLSAIRKVLGPHVWQTGASKRPDSAHLDVTHYRLPTDEEVDRIEELANDIVSKNLQVEAVWMERGEAERRYGPIIYQGGVVPGSMLRLLVVGDWDAEACGGTHVSSTGEIKYIKIVDVEKIHEGVIRFTFLAGDAAIRRARREHKILDDMSRLLKVSIDEVGDAVKRLLSEKEELERDYSNLRRSYLELLADKLYKEAAEVDGLKYVDYVGDVEDIIYLSEVLEKRYRDVIVVGISRIGRGVNVTMMVGVEARERGVNAYELLSSLSRELFRGGGKGDARYARFGGRSEYGIDELRRRIRSYVEGRLRSR